MKIIRCVTEDGTRHWARQEEGGGARRIDGDLFGEWKVTDEQIVPKRLLAPIEPRQILAIGLNYREHAAETGAKIPTWPVLFIKALNAVTGPGEPIILPTHLASHKVDYEAELAVVIGRTCKNVARAEALQHVLGYTCANDVSARDWQREFGGGQYCRGKSFDSFAPMGPCLVTSDDIPNPNALDIRTIIDGETLQDHTTADMIFDVATLIEFLSGSTTLLAGTVILTGTPQGVGMARTPPRWLKPGDEVTVEIEGIGRLTNPVIQEP